MENISLKLEPQISKKMEGAMKQGNYMTKAEFIREAIRDKMKEIEKQKALAKLRKIYGASKRKTTDEQLHKAREEAFEEIKAEFGVK